MPASIHNAAAFFARETFSVWDPASNTFSGELIGRKKRIDAFVSLWHRSTRREHLYFRMGQEAALTAAIVMRHDNSGGIYLCSETIERDYWVNDSHYVTMIRAHRVSPPSGGQATLLQVNVMGAGDDLGPVVLGPAHLGWADAELRSTRATEGTEEVSSGEYFVTYSRNLSAREGDFITVRGDSYRLLETHSDSGYLYARAAQDTPKFKTAAFKLPSTTPAVFDPVTGTMTGGAEVTRLVSVLIGNRELAGATPEHDVQETLELYIYLAHIGFEPQLGRSLELDGKRFRIVSVERRLEEKQYKLVVSP